MPLVGRCGIVAAARHTSRVHPSVGEERAPQTGLAAPRDRLRVLVDDRADRAAAALGFFLVVTLVWLAPLVHHLGSSVLYGPTDSTSTIRDYWAAEHLHTTPVTITRDPLNGAPEGIPRSDAIAVANFVQPAVILLLKPVFGLVASWNLFLLAGFVLTGWVTFLLLDRLRIHPLAALFGGYVFAFSPWMFERSYQGHAGMLHLWVLPLLVIACLRLHERRSVGAAALVGACLPLAFYLQSYLGLMASVIFAAFFAIELITAAERLWTFLLLDIAIVTALVLFAPPLVMWLHAPGDVASAVSEPLSDLKRGGARVADYLLPSWRNPVLGGIRRAWGTDSGEHLLSPGWITTALAVAGATIALRRRASEQPRDRRFVALLACTVVVVGFISSLSPIVDIGPIQLRTPSDLIYRAAPFWRAYARVGIDVILALVILAGFALDRILRRRHGYLVFAVLAVLTVVELLDSKPPVPTWSTAAAPAHVAWLAEHPGGIVAVYPLPIESKQALQLGGEEFFYQTKHAHPLYALWGGNIGGTREEAIRLLSSSITDPDTPGVLAAEHIRYVVVDDAVYRAQGMDPPTVAPGLREIARAGDARIFGVDAKPADLDALLDVKSGVIALQRALPSPALNVVSGFYGPENYQSDRNWRWLQQDGRLEATGVVPGRYRVVGQAFANAVPRRVSVLDDHGRTLGSQDVTTAQGPISIGPFDVGSSAHLTLHVDPGPAALGATDPRVASVFVSPLALQPAPDFYGSLADR